MSKASKITASELVLSAIFFLQQKNGVTAGDIVKFICGKRGCEQSLVKGEVKKALNRGTKKGVFNKKKGLFRIKSRFGSNEMSEKSNKLHKGKKCRNFRPENTAELWDREIQLECPLEDKILKSEVSNTSESPSLSWKEGFGKKFGNSENSDRNYYNNEESTPGERFNIYGIKDEEDDDEDFLEEEDDDDDDRDYFADEQFPKPEDALKEACRRPPRKKDCRPKRKAKSRSKSKGKCKSKRRKPSKRSKRSCRRKKIMKCDTKKPRNYYDDSSLDEESNYGNDKNEDERDRKFDTESDDDNEEDKNNEAENEGDQEERTFNKTGNKTKPAGKNAKENLDGTSSGDDNDDEGCDYNEDEEDEQSDDTKELKKAEKMYQTNHTKADQKDYNNKEVNQIKHGEFKETEKTSATVNNSEIRDFKKNAEDGNTGGSMPSARSSPHTNENASSNRGYPNKKSKRERSSSLISSSKKKPDGEDKDSKRKRKRLI